MLKVISFAILTPSEQLKVSYFSQSMWLENLIIFGSLKSVTVLWRWPGAKNDINL